MTRVEESKIMSAVSVASLASHRSTSHRGISRSQIHTLHHTHFSMEMYLSYRFRRRSRRHSQHLRHLPSQLIRDSVRLRRVDMGRVWMRLNPQSSGGAIYLIRMLKKLIKNSNQRSSTASKSSTVIVTTTITGMSQA